MNKEEKGYSKDYALGYTTALNHTKLALEELVETINKVEEEILDQTNFKEEK